jgi:hypothetical protein
MDDTDHALFPRFSAELVATALKDTPLAMASTVSSSMVMNSRLPATRKSEARNRIF